MSNTIYVGLVGVCVCVCVNIVHKQLVVQLFQNQGGELNNSPQEYLECGWKSALPQVKQGRKRNTSYVVEIDLGYNEGIGLHVLVPWWEKRKRASFFDFYLASENAPDSTVKSNSLNSSVGQRISNAKIMGWFNSEPNAQLKIDHSVWFIGEPNALQNMDFSA